MAYHNQTINTRSGSNCPACGRTDIRNNSNSVQGNRSVMYGNRMAGSRMQASMSCNKMQNNNMVCGRMQDTKMPCKAETSCPIPCAPVLKVPEHREKDIFSCIDGAPLAMSYVPFQGSYDELYNLEKALDRGTIFPELDKPFTGGGCHEKC